MIKRATDLFIALIILLIFFIPLLIIAFLVLITSKGPIIFWSDRVGRRNVIFKMPKFRTMRVNTPNVATHLLNSAEQYLTPIGGFLRKTSLDELPQLWSVIVGDMSFVGPRPALYNQYDLIEMRVQNGIDTLLPGITGWAQVNGRDELSLEEKVAFDREYLEKQSLLFDSFISFLTILKIFKREGVSH